ncbi:hypothetical protein [Clostridium botulinum]|uniref:hypothetical protein n=1 Tax=Clostridium botulinum TaxID=1491 RepID=UPI001C9B1031|nr:hypothetical protein [Clostridium botulinum]MBY6838666.1 hypothetical protein [Clostridium botulinum]
MNLAEELYKQSIKNSISIPKDMINFIQKEVENGLTSLTVYNNYYDFNKYKLAIDCKEQLIANGFKIYKGCSSNEYITISWDMED